MPYSDKEWFALSRCAPDTGEELDWYALDSQGHLAIFTTAGLGPVPAAVWAHREELYQLEVMITGLASGDTFQKIFTGPGNYLEWCDFARKGLFAFDYQDVHRTNRLHAYDLIARPDSPLAAPLLLPHVDLRWLPVVRINFAACTQVSDTVISNAEPGASPNGGSAERVGDSTSSGGPPSVS